MDAASEPLRLSITRLFVSQPGSTFIASTAVVPAGISLSSTAGPGEMAAARSTVWGRRLQGMLLAAAGGTGAGGNPAGRAPAARGSRRALLAPQTAANAEGTWLQVVVVAGGTDPIQMYNSSEEKLQ